MTDTIPLEQEPLPAGQILKASRLEQGLTLEQVSKSLCISKRLLFQLEEDEKHLVCDVYTLGFIKLYAQLLNLAPQEIVEKFKERATPSPKPPHLIFPAPLPGRGMPSFRIIAFSLLVLAALGIGGKWMSDYNSAPYSPSEPETPNKEIAEEKKAPQETEPLFVQNSTALEETATIQKPTPLQQADTPNSSNQQTVFTNFSIEETTPEKTSSLAPEPSQETVNLNVTEEAWIEVKDKGGEIILSKLFRSGESFEFKNGKDLILKTGNLRGTHLSSGKKIFPVSEKPGEVRQGISLDPEKWSE